MSKNAKNQFSDILPPPARSAEEKFFGRPPYVGGVPGGGPGGLSLVKKIPARLRESPAQENGTFFKERFFKKKKTPRSLKKRPEDIINSKNVMCDP